MPVTYPLQQTGLFLCYTWWALELTNNLCSSRINLYILILLPPPPEFYDCWHGPPFLVHALMRTEPRIACRLSKHSVDRATVTSPWPCFHNRQCHSNTDASKNQHYTLINFFVGICSEGFKVHGPRCPADPLWEALGVVSFLPLSESMVLAFWNLPSGVLLSYLSLAEVGTISRFHLAGSSELEDQRD